MNVKGLIEITAATAVVLGALTAAVKEFGNYVKESEKSKTETAGE